MLDSDLVAVVAEDLGDGAADVDVVRCGPPHRQHVHDVRPVGAHDGPVGAVEMEDRAQLPDGEDVVAPRTPDAVEGAVAERPERPSRAIELRDETRRAHGDDVV